MKTPIQFLVTYALTASLGFSLSAFAEETKGEKAETAMNKTADNVKKGFRSTKDKTCEMVNGKMECVAKKMKHKVQNAADSVETKANEVKNKTD